MIEQLLRGLAGVMAVLLSLKNISLSLPPFLPSSSSLSIPFTSLTLCTSLSLSSSLSPSFYGAGATEEWFSKGKLLLLYDMRFACSNLLVISL
jgi:hypothetical protein